MLLSMVFHIFDFVPICLQKCMVFFGYQFRLFIEKCMFSPLEAQPLVRILPINAVAMFFQWPFQWYIVMLCSDFRVTPFFSVHFGVNVTHFSHPNVYYNLEYFLLWYQIVIKVSVLPAATEKHKNRIFRKFKILLCVEWNKLTHAAGAGQIEIFLYQ